MVYVYSFLVLLLTNYVIKAVENLAEKQGMKSLKLTRKNDVLFHPADWIAGVDYEDVDNCMSVFRLGLRCSASAMSVFNPEFPDAVGNCCSLC